MNSYVRDNVDVIVIGAGHAGCEAALATARMNMKTVILSISLDSIAMMPCNPSIGGSSKGHLVREIDALGGEMGKNIDKTFIQSRMLNLGKGPAVYSLRAQADKHEYSKQMKRVLERCENLQIVQGEVSDILVSQSKVTGVQLLSGAIFYAKAVIIAAGTYVRSRCLYGETIVESGPSGLKSSTLLSEALRKLNVKLYRFKTGTPARIDKKSIDFNKMTIQQGDVPVVPFSFETDLSLLNIKQVPCYLTYTNSLTHDIIRKNIHRSPMYSGIIEGTGTRYCPSIEDKIVRFADKERHQVFIEPEGLSTDEMYVQGMSTSLPEDVQLQMYRSVIGLEKCQIMRNAYAIEYDCIDATQLNLTLEFKSISGLYSAGQFNGSSGYEEAAAQGLIAGINSALKIKGCAPIILDRSDAYIGVLIDDLVTKGTKEPYRMMTSRAEYRLLLRQDNADLRLTPIGFNVGLISKQRYDNFLAKRQLIENEIKRVNKVIIAPDDTVNTLLEQFKSSKISTGIPLSYLIKRPELDYFKLSLIDSGRVELPFSVSEQVGIAIKYEGYINKQELQVEQFKKLENKFLPDDIDYSQIKGLRLEARQKLNSIRPNSIGHASRITGVSPADISVLLVFLKSLKGTKKF